MSLEPEKPDLVNDEGKMWYESKAIWSSLVIIFFSLYRLITGYIVSPEDQNTAMQNVYQIAMLLFGAGAWWGRFKATNKISAKAL